MKPGTRKHRPIMMAVIVLGLTIILLLLAGGYLASRMPGQSFTGAPPTLSNEQSALRTRLRQHIQALAGEIGERHVWKPVQLDAAATYIETRFRAAGLQPRAISYRVGETSVRNIEVILAGNDPSPKTLVVGAHYDTVPGTPGANDNASGVAALIELALALQAEAPAHTIRCVAFVNEEPPFFKTGQMGSRVYAQRLKQEGVAVAGMLSLETIGYFSHESGSQRFPLPLLKLFFPDKGHFLAFVGDLASRHFLRETIGAFRTTARVPSEGLSAPGWVTGVDWSDHWSFWQEGWPAIMLTDTAIFRYPHYHAAGDTPDRVDYDTLTRIVSALQASLRRG